MRSLLLAVALGVVFDGSAFAGDAVVVLQERRTRLTGKKQQVVEHVALLKNTSSQGVRGLRVTVELHDTFGKLLWTRTVTPGPSALQPGDTASLSVTTPYLVDYKKTVYRFEYRADARARAVPRSR